MESSVLGLVLDSSVLIDGERKGFLPDEVLENVRKVVGDVPLAVCPLTLAEVGHGIYRAGDSSRARARRAFLDEIAATVRIYHMTEITAEIIARVGAEQAAKGINLPLGDLIIGACALELNYAVGTANLRDFRRIPGLTVIPL